MNVLSLFSGIGGLELGLERVGMTVIGQVEINSYCRSVLAAHWPEVPRHDDVRTTIEWWRRESRPPVHVVAGGFPCQPVSQTGQKLAQEDARWLWPEMAAVIADIRPRWVIAENVPGLLKRGFGDVLRDLAALGYDAEWDCIPAASIGAPHRRDRVFIVAYPQSVGRGTRRPGRPDDGASDGSRLALSAESLVADADRQGCDERPRTRVAAAGWRQPTNGSGELPDADVAGLEGRRVYRSAPECHKWPAEPRVGRVAHGVPAQVDRLRSLGNAVVPQVAEHIGGMIVNAFRLEAAACSGSAAARGLADDA